MQLYQGTFVGQINCNTIYTQFPSRTVLIVIVVKKKKRSRDSNSGITQSNYPDENELIKLKYSTCSQYSMHSALKYRASNCMQKKP